MSKNTSKAQSGTARKAPSTGGGTPDGQETGQLDVGVQPAAPHEAQAPVPADGAAPVAEIPSIESANAGEQPPTKADEAPSASSETPAKAPVFPKNVVGRKGAATAFGIAEDEVLDFSWTKDRLVVVTVAGQKLRVEAAADRAGEA